MRKLLLALFVLVVVVCLGLFLYRGKCDDKADVIEFPYQVVMAPQNLLIVDGYELRGKVVFTWEEGDSLRVNGIPIVPSRLSPFRPPPEEEMRKKAWWREKLMELPYVAELVRSGKTVEEASEIYDRRCENAVDSVIAAYWRKYLATGSTDSGVAAAWGALDTVLFDPSQTKIFPSGLVTKFKGRQYDFTIAFRDKPPWEYPSREEMSRFTYEKACYHVRSLRMDLKTSDTQVLVVNGSYRVMGGRVVDEAVAQIEAGLKGRYIKGPLSEEDVRWVLLRRGVKVDELH